MNINVFGDVTGFVDTFKALIARMPEGQILGLGDLIDRGPGSKEVMDFFIDNGHQSVMGNHDHMMLMKYMQYNRDVHHNLYHFTDWENNGGRQAAKSFGFDNTYVFDFKKIDPKYVEFIKQMPLKKEVGDFIFTHAPINDKKNAKAFDLKEINKDPFLLHRSILWNRLPPSKIEGKFQVYGHNSPKHGILWHTDKYPQGIYMHNELEVPHDIWGVCIDTWRKGFLTGLSINTDISNNPREAIKVFIQPLVESDVKAMKEMYGK